jgi:hydroxyethylthiazole kinase-like uncharacterized protein yjeF
VTTPRPILTAAAMRAAELGCGTALALLMERAGAAVAEAVWRHAAGAPTLILCGPGNNGGDGYVAARLLHARGVAVTVAATSEPATALAGAARAAWDGPVTTLAAADARPVLIDALFGTGLTRGLDAQTLAEWRRLAADARHRIAVDLPSGVETDTGATFDRDLPGATMTVALGALKPAHRLQPAAALCGRVVVADIGLGAVASDLVEVARPYLPAPGPADHKYTRGPVAVVAGGMGGAALLAATAAQRAGSGYVRLVGGAGSGGLQALVHLDGMDILSDPHHGAVLCGPGMDKSDRAPFDAAMACGRPLVLDAGALRMVDMAALCGLPHRPILTPHGGEFTALFGTIAGDRVAQARVAAERAQAIIVLKGADTVVAAPDGRAAIAPPASHWLATAGTGDVLAGIMAAMRARIADPFMAAQAALWLHGRAAEMAGAVLVADDLADHLGKAVEECL